MNKSNATRLITLISIILTTFQATIPNMPITDTTLISAVVMFLVIILTAWKQYLSVEIRDGAMWPTLIIFVTAIMGGLNDLVNAVHVPAALGQWLRFGITTIVMILNVTSKGIFPTYESKVIEQAKKDLTSPT